MKAAMFVVLGIVLGTVPRGTAQDRSPFQLGVATATRTVVVAGELSRERRLLVASHLAALRFPGVLLWDSATARVPNRRFLEQFQSEAVIALAADPQDVAGNRRLDWSDPIPGELAHAWRGRASRVLIASSSRWREYLQASMLASAQGLPLLPMPTDDESAQKLERLLESWDTREIWHLGELPAQLARSEVWRLRAISGEEELEREILRHHQPVRTLVAANPTDAGLVELAPWVARNRQAALVLTREDGTDLAPRVRTLLQQPEARRVENLLILARLPAIPTERRENPVPGKDPEIEMEPTTPGANEPWSLATGRLFHADAAIVALQLARARLLPAPGSPRKAMVASNPGSSLPLLETCSRLSARELANRGYETTALIGDVLTPGQLRRRLPECDLFLWEGHHSTLIKDWGFATWDEPLRPALMFLQSCLALTEEKATPLLDRGALAVVGSSTRIFSATGGAFSLAYLDALLYGEQSLGGALRQSKNFLLAYSQFKQQRLGDQAKLTGANLRSAWAFTLWGDPEQHLPAGPRDEAALPASQLRVRGDAILATMPEAQGAVEAGKYRAPYRPNMRVAGLVRPGSDDDRRLVPFVFGELALSPPSEGAIPRLESKLDRANWTFLWDARRSRGYLLALPREGATEARWKVRWDMADRADKQNARPGEPVGSGAATSRDAIPERNSP